MQPVVIERDGIERGSIQQVALEIAFRNEREIDAARVAQCKIVKEPFYNPGDVVGSRLSLERGDAQPTHTVAQISAWPMRPAAWPSRG